MRTIIKDESILRSLDAFRPDKAFGPASEHVIRVFYQNILKPGDTAIDVGVHYGIHLFPMSDAVGETGKVIGIEASPERFEAMQARAGSEGRDNIQILNMAAGNAERTMTFYLNRTFTGRSGLIENKKHDTDVVDTIDVKMRPLDDVLTDLTRLHFIKIDVEGAETMVMQGAANLIRRFAPFIIFEGRLNESAKSCGIAFDDILATFSNHAFFDLFGQEVDFRTHFGAGWNFLAAPRSEHVLDAAGAALSAAWKQQIDANQGA